MSDFTRRELLQGMLAIPAGLALSPEAAERAAPGREQGAAAAYVPVNFTSDEWQLVRLLVNYVIPRDVHSGSATDAGVPEFMDFILGEYASHRQWMKEGLGWMNAECRTRHGKGFVSCTDVQRRAVLDAIAFPKKAAPAMKAGVDFFNRFRDMTASGFFSSKIGVADLGYIGNRPVAKWEGTPPAVMKKLGLSAVTVPAPPAAGGAPRRPR